MTKKIVMKCNHCGNKAAFKQLIEHVGKEYDHIERLGKVVYNTRWEFLECQTCSSPTLLRSAEWCQIYEEDEWSTAPSTTGWLPKHGDEVNCEPLSDEEVVYPIFVPFVTPSPDMPEDIAKDFNEARVVFAASPRASAALLRLVIQKLCIHLGQKGENLNNDIAVLVHQGLPVQIQQALDSIRVIGNNAVHPAKIDMLDDSEVAIKLFDLVNFIVREMITRPREITEIYHKLPEEARSQIQTRQKKLTEKHSSK